MEDKVKKIIIRRVKKGHGGHHGGSWKVAYADFVTAMMAFFLLMWLINMNSPERRAVLALYFKNFSLFKTGGTSFTWDGSKSIMDNNSPTKGAGGDITEGGHNQYGLSPEQLKGWLFSQINEKLQEAYQKNILLEVTKSGVRAQLIDMEGSAMFPPGSSQLTESAKAIIKVIAEATSNLTNKVAIEGHTDSSQPTGEITNWELSLARACTARKELELHGIQPNRIARVDGFADRIPLYENKPDDARNRRVSIVFLYEEPPKQPGSKNFSDLLESKY